MSRGKVLGILALFLAPLVAFIGVASAQSFRSGDNTQVGQSEVVDSSLWAVGRNIDISGEVQGDVFCAGQNVSITGKVTGDVICAGQTVSIYGTVEGDVRVAGQNVTIGAQIHGNLTAGGQNVSLESSAKVGGDAAIGGDGQAVNGSVGRDLSITGSTVTLTNEVGRNVKATAEELVLTDNAKVGGDLTYTSTNEARVSNGAEVAGQSVRYDPPEDSNTSGMFGAPSFGFIVYMVLALLLVALALSLLFPGLLHATTSRAVTEPGKTALIGLVALIVVPVVIVSLMITVIGIPLGILLFFLWIPLLMLAGPTFGYYLGRMLFKEQRNPVVIMLLGSAVSLLLHLIPIVGFFTLVASMLLGTGMLIRELLRRTPRPHYDLAKPTKAK